MSSGNCFICCYCSNDGKTQYNPCCIIRRDQAQYGCVPLCCYWGPEWCVSPYYCNDDMKNRHCIPWLCCYTQGDECVACPLYCRYENLVSCFPLACFNRVSPRQTCIMPCVYEDSRTLITPVYCYREGIQNTYKCFLIFFWAYNNSTERFPTNLAFCCGETKSDLKKPITHPTKQYMADKCVVCLDRPANCGFSPCGHVCVCEGCIKDVHKTFKKCPICSQEYKNVYTKK